MFGSITTGKRGSPFSQVMFLSLFGRKFLLSMRQEIVCRLQSRDIEVKSFFFLGAPNFKHTIYVDKFMCIQIVNKKLSMSKVIT